MYIIKIVYINISPEMHRFLVFKVCLWHSAPYVHLLPEYRPQPDVALPYEDDPQFLACSVLSENLPQFDFGEFPHCPLEINTPTILNGPTRRNSVHLNQVSVEARQLVYLYLYTDQETFDSGTCGQ
jgi:hypothetical protein